MRTLYWLANRAFITLILICVAQGTFAIEHLPFYNSKTFTPHWLEPKSEALNDFHSIPNFSFMNQFGEQVTQADLENKIYVASFFFTTCPGICPAIKSKLEAVHQAYKNESNVKILSHSIRPQHDTVEVLKNYAKRNAIEGDSWLLLTGDHDEIYTLAKTAYFASEDLGEIQNTDEFLHTENLLLIDGNRHIRGIYNGLSTSSVKHLIKDIELLLKN